MENEFVFIMGIIAAVIWLFLCVIMEKSRKYIIGLGIVADVILFVSCMNYEFLLLGLGTGILGGFGLIPARRLKYKETRKEFGGVKNVVVVFTIFAVMVFMFLAIRSPGVTIEW